MADDPQAQFALTLFPEAEKLPELAKNQHARRSGSRRRASGVRAPAVARRASGRPPKILGLMPCHNLLRLLDLSAEFLPQRAGLARLARSSPDSTTGRTRRTCVSNVSKSPVSNPFPIARSSRSTAGDGDCRPERLRQEQRRRRPHLGHGRTEREEPARREDGRRHLQRLRRAQADRRGRGAAAVQRRRAGAVARCPAAAPALPPDSHEPAPTAATATATATATAMATATATAITSPTCWRRFARSKSRAGSIDRARANT